ncbi:arylamine N-acetyltransferase family protein [Staphylococcus canis]|uniref:Arylamine N-acetyltransferase n=1 Tax=Staphylococcus canis TaxID=2724942 RepID=A0ABS0TBD8_9STAP|nr:arylamine N-acetyltransferase [Staphylococcus canis]MBI5975727.1 arylamine N-acetyltransferase [Staphylococcus canis]
MDFTQFEKRLNLHDTAHEGLTVEVLNQYMRQFMLNIPFEAIDVQNQVPISRQPEAIFEKIVTQHRGGFCYEMNGLFKAYLDDKGFQTSVIAGTVHQANGARTKRGAHMALLVHFDDDVYVADVGFGDLPMQAMPITEDGSRVVHDVNGDYRAVLNDTLIDVQKYIDGTWTTMYDALYQDQPFEYFNEMLDYNQYDPEAVFVQHLLITKPTVDGRVTMSENHLTIQKQGKKEKIDVTPDNYRALLKKYFGLDVRIERLEKRST